MFHPRNRETGFAGLLQAGTPGDPEPTGAEPVSALPQAIPLSLAAAFSPAALLVLIVLLAADHPRRLVFSYLAGAATFVAVVGIGGLLLLSISGATEQDSRSTSASVDLVLGVALLTLAAWAWRRRHHPPKEGNGRGGISSITHRATTSMKWAFAAGILVYVASPSYIGAIKAIADSGDSTAGQLLAVLICGVCMLLFVEVPALFLLLRPDGVKATLERFTGWLSTNSWNLVAILAAAAGAWLLVSTLLSLG